MSATTFPMRGLSARLVRISGIFAPSGFALLVAFALPVPAVAARFAVPKAHPGGTTIKHDAGTRFATNGASLYFIGKAGHLWAWGSNKVGELGNGSTTDHSVPARVWFPTSLGRASIDRVAISTQGSVYALDSAGHLWAWGDNEYGQLGVGWGDLRDRSVPTLVRFPAALSGAPIVGMAVNDTSESVYAVDSLGHLWAWGQNDFDQLGIRSSTDQDAPVQVQFPLALGHASIISVVIGHGTVYAVDDKGRVWNWGSGGTQLGNGHGGSASVSNIPTRVRFPEGLGHAAIVRVAADARGDAYALDSIGHLWAWGYGNLGTGMAGRQSSPARAQFPAHWWQRSVSIARVVAAGFGQDNVGYAIDTSGHLWAWGHDPYALPDAPPGVVRHTPERVRFPSILGRVSIVRVSVPIHSAAYAIDSTGRLWAWGNNRYGQLGNGHLVNRFNPPAPVGFPVAPGGTSTRDIWSNTSPARAFASAYALDRAGRLWTWGYSRRGPLGDRSRAIVLSPAPIQFPVHVPEPARVASAPTGAASRCTAGKPQFVYVAEGEGIAAYRADTATGALTEVPGSPFPDPGHPNFVTANPSGTALYVTNSSNTLSVYHIDAATGALTEVAGGPFKVGGQPYLVKFNSPGTLAYVGNWHWSAFTTYRIDPSTGAPVAADDGQPSAAQLGRTLPNPNVTISPAGPFAYWVANDGILVFRIDLANGSNHELPGAKIDRPFARAITINPEGTLAYLTERSPWAGGSVSAYRLNESTGALTPVSGNPVAKGLFRPAPVAIDCTGTLAYVAEMGNGFSKSAISAYRINATTGALTAIAGSPFATGVFPVFAAVVQP